jgi:DNA (cytosine-5)-methyltransferase 1
MAKKVLVADLLCGAGGSSTGCERALADMGLKMELVCVNHWGVAIETHRRNHPDARHYVQDISTVRPHIIVPEGYLDLLMASPTCTHHSVARGGKPTSDQQRSDPWHIITWFTELRVKRAIIENVWEYIGWGPVDPKTGKPIKERRGEYFNAWVDTIRRLGATSIEYKKLNAADYGDATTRSRFIMMIRFDKRPISWPRPTHYRREDGKLELFPGLKPWRPAREIIDWDLKGKSIFDRKKPLAPKTLARIYAGAVKFNWPDPFLVILRNHMSAQSTGAPLPAIMANGKHIGLAQPILFANRTNNAAKNPDASPAPTFTTAPGGGIILAEPVILNGRKNNTAQGVSTTPVPTLDTKGYVWMAEPVTRDGAIPTFEEWFADTKDLGGSREEYDRLYPAEPEPIVLSQHNSGAPRGVNRDPLPTVTTGGAGAEDHPGCARPMLVQPFVLNRHGADGGAERSKATDEPIPPPTTAGAGYLIEPFILSRHAGGAPRSTQDPTPTQVAKQSHVLISPYYSTGSGETCTSADLDPLPTATAKARFGMVVPVTHTQGGNQARDTEVDPIATMTTSKGGEFALVMPVTHHDTSNRARDPDVQPLPTPTGANRGELAFITAQFGERPGQAPRVHDLDQPAPTPTATGHIDLAEGVTDGRQFDILFRMLEPHELAAAMGFTDEEYTYEFAGTKTEQIKQIGNAVSVAKMKACVGAIMADAAPKQRRRRAIPSTAKRRAA